jgi:hypothetical protein
MPAGVNHPALGYLIFCGVKAVGYTAAAAVISRAYKRTDVNPLVVGVTRTLIGMATGVAFFGIVLATAGLQFERGIEVALAVITLIILRFLEWWILVYAFYDRHLSSPRRDWIVVVLGTVWSFVLDIPAALGYIFTCGFWVC